MKNTFLLFFIFQISIINLSYAEIAGQPAHSWVQGSNWYCDNGYKKTDNQCVSIFVGMPNGQQLAHSWVQGANWYCDNGYKKTDTQCVSIFAGMPNGQQPSNSWVQGQNWYCDNGYKKSGNQCVSIFLDEKNNAQNNQEIKNVKNKSSADSDPSFDCIKAKSIPEKLICSDNQLKTLDRDLYNFYVQAKLLVNDQENFKKETVSAWKIREKECVDKTCLLNWYVVRKNYYTKIISDAKSNNTPDHNAVIINADRNQSDRENQQLTNNNKLPFCPKPDFSKNNDVGVGGRTEKWNYCWGKYTVQLDGNWKGDILEGEWRNGLLDGQGFYQFIKGNKYRGEFRNGLKNGQGIFTFANGEEYIGEFKDNIISGQGSYTWTDGNKYVGEFKDGKRNGKGTYNFASGNKYIGEFKDDKYNGQGIFTFADGRKQEGIWDAGKFIREARVNLPAFNNNPVANNERNQIERERQQLAEERRRLEEDKRNREQARANQRINLQITNTQPNAEGDFTINIQTNADTASLKINDDEIGGRQDGSYTIKRVARAGQTTQLTIIAKDVYGNTDTKTIAVTRQTVVANQAKYAELNPAIIKSQPAKDAVAIIIGIQNYKRVPKADYANQDAQSFYDYAIRALGVKPENIKLLIDEQADDIEILAAFENWLPVKVRKQKTDVYVFYSGHGFPSDDGSSLYILPYGADKQFIARTAVNQQEIIRALQSIQAKSVTMFMDACYSGQIRTGETLLASARPIAIKQNVSVFPAEFTVITASQSDQIASSSPELKHGIFSYYLMKGLEGDADENQDNKITAGEMQSYLQDMVTRKAMAINRRQMPQLMGDATRVLVGK